MLIKSAKLTNGKTCDIYIENGIIKEMSGSITKDSEVIDASGLLVMPGLIDLHVHLRDPGQTDKEDIASGAKAAARGGFTTICAMPNTDPPIDTQETVEYIHKKAQKEADINVLIVAAMTMGQFGYIPTKIGEMNPICAVSEDGKSVDDAGLMKDIMENAARLGLPVFSHAEEASIFGSPPETEEIIVARDMLLSKLTNAHVHFCHISSRYSLDLIRLAKKWELKVTAETAPHYFLFTEDNVTLESGIYKMNPPLKTKEDVEAIKAALKDGTLDCIATDHAPHLTKEKNAPFKISPNGITGLESSFAASYTTLVKNGDLTLEELENLMCKNPAKILGMDLGKIEVGKKADIAIFDIYNPFVVKAEDFQSKCKINPYVGKTFYGKTKYTIANGKVVYHD